MEHRTKNGAAPIAVGDVMRFKAEHDRARYGATATVTRVSWSVDQPHPGRIHHQWVDLTTENGTAVQWTVGSVRGRLTVVAK